MQMYFSVKTAGAIFFRFYEVVRSLIHSQSFILNANQDSEAMLSACVASGKTVKLSQEVAKA